MNIKHVLCIFAALLGLLYLHGAECKLKHLQLHSNRLDSINHLLQCVVGLHNLKDLTLSKDGSHNPVCSQQGLYERPKRKSDISFFKQESC